jgi:hypothetical protein
MLVEVEGVGTHQTNARLGAPPKSLGVLLENARWAGMLASLGRRALRTARRRSDMMVGGGEKEVECDRVTAAISGEPLSEF